MKCFTPAGVKTFPLSFFFILFYFILRICPSYYNLNLSNPKKEGCALGKTVSGNFTAFRKAVKFPVIRDIQEFVCCMFSPYGSTNRIFLNSCRPSLTAFPCELSSLSNMSCSVFSSSSPLESNALV